LRASGCVDSPGARGQRSQKRYVGSSPSLTVVWTATRHMTVQASYVHFFADPFLQETPPGKDINYVTVWLAYKF